MASSQLVPVSALNSHIAQLLVSTGRFLLLLLLAIAVIFGICFGYDNTQAHHLTLTAGSPSGDYRNLRIKVISTCRSAQNLALLAMG